MLNLKKLLISLLFLSTPLQLKSVQFTADEVVTSAYIAGIIGTISGTFRALGEGASYKKSNYESYLNGFHNGMDFVTFLNLISDISHRRDYEALLGGSFLLCKTIAYQIMRSDKAS